MTGQQELFTEGKETPAENRGSFPLQSGVSDPIPLTWGCLQDEDSTTWVLAKIIGDRAYDIKATTMRKRNGSWDWWIYGTKHGGNSPARTEAMEMIEKLLKEKGC